MIVNATINSDGSYSDQGNLDWQVASYSESDLDNTDKSNGSGFNASFSKGSTTLGANNSGHDKQGQTLATIGKIKQGIKVGANQDLNNSQKITQDWQTGGLNASLTADHRVFTKGGRNIIVEDFVNTYEYSEDFINAGKDMVTDDRVLITDAYPLFQNNVKATQLKNDLIKNPANAALLNGLKSKNPEVQLAAQKQLARLAQEKHGLAPSDLNFYDGKKTTSPKLSDGENKNVRGATVAKKGHSEYGNIFVDATDSHLTKKELMKTIGHEVLRTQQTHTGSQEGERDTAKAENFGNKLSRRMNDALGGRLSSLLGNTQNTNAVYTGTKKANKVGSADVLYDVFNLQNQEIHPKSMELLNKLDKITPGIDYYITSRIRTPDKNEKIGGAKKSTHLLEYGGTAIDVNPNSSKYDYDIYEIAKKASQTGFTGIITYTNKNNTSISRHGRLNLDKRNKKYHADTIKINEKTIYVKKNYD